VIASGWLSLLIALAVWELVWKGLALWRAGKNKQLAWFVVMLVLNTAGILEIIYLVFFSHKQLKKS
jgi:methionyl-tRNA synthetase